MRKASPISSNFRIRSWHGSPTPWAIKAEAQKSAHSTNPDAINLTMRGWAALWQASTKESVTSARDYFERAIKLDPQNPEATVGLAYARFRASAWSTTAEDAYAAQLELLTKATAINPGYAFAYYVKSLASFRTKQLPQAIEAVAEMHQRRGTQ